MRAAVRAAGGEVRTVRPLLQANRSLPPALLSSDSDGISGRFLPRQRSLSNAFAQAHSARKLSTLRRHRPMRLLVVGSGLIGAQRIQALTKLPAVSEITVFDLKVPEGTKLSAKGCQPSAETPPSPKSTMPPSLPTTPRHCR